MYESTPKASGPICQGRAAVPEADEEGSLVSIADSDGSGDVSFAELLTFVLGMYLVLGGQLCIRFIPMY